MRRRRLRSSSGRRFEMPYVCGWPGTITTNRPARLTSCVRRAPLCAIGFLVTCTMIDWPLRSIRSMRGGCTAFHVGVVVDDVAAVQHAVLRCADVDERGLHARQHVLHAAEVDVAVDRSRVVGRQRDVVLHERAAFEHADVGHAVVPLVHHHEVAARGPALPPRAPAAFQRLLVERIQDRGAVDVDVADRGTRVHVRRGIAATPARGRRRAAGTSAVAVAVALTALAAASTAPPAPALLRCAFAVGRGLATRGRRPAVAHLGLRGRAAGAGRESPIRGRPPFRVGRPASSRASSPRSSDVSPRSADASVQSSPRPPTRGGTSSSSSSRPVSRALPAPSSSSSSVRPRPHRRPPPAFAPEPAGRFRPRPPREPRRRRFLGAPSAVVSTVPSGASASCRASARVGVGDFRSDGDRGGGCAPRLLRCRVGRRPRVVGALELGHCCLPS